MPPAAATANHTAEETPAATRPIRPLPAQKRLFDDGTPLPPVGSMAAQGKAFAVVRRFRKQLAEMPFAFRKWIAASLMDDVEHEEAGLDDPRLDELGPV